MRSFSDEDLALFRSVVNALEIVKDNPPLDNRGFENSPSYKMAHPLAKYQVLARLLGEEDIGFLHARGFDVKGQRALRRKVYLEYVAVLEDDVRLIFRQRLEAASASAADVFRDRAKANAHVARMRRYALMHRMRLPGVTGGVAGTLRELRDLLGLNQVVLIRADA